MKRAPGATVHPTTADLHWAAGFLEGEGFFGKASSGKGHRVVARQVQREPLERLLAFFGGSICLVKPASMKRPIYDWTTSGARARGIMMTLFVLMSPRRKQQIRDALRA
jgi:hypothetical protein